MNEALLVSGMFLVTFLIRYLPFGLAGCLRIPEPLERALRYVPVAVLMAITAPAILIPDGNSIQLSWTNPHLVGALAAFIAGWWKNNLLLTIMLGMSAFIVSRLVMENI
jgi:branched-subunit amino acid transport protein